MKTTSFLGVTIAFLSVLSASAQPAEHPPAGQPRTANWTSATVRGGYGLSFSGSSSVPPLVLRFSDAEPAASRAMEEDLNVMTHLIERGLEQGIGEASPEVKMGIPLLYSGGRSVRAMYVEGFGALFMIKVNFPLHAPAAPEPQEPAPATDSEWEKARREVFGWPADRWETDAPGGGARFDAEQVEAFKKVLLQSFKNAANIRSLKPDEFVAVSAFGHPVFAARPARTTGGRGGGSERAVAELKRSQDDLRKAQDDLARANAMVRSLRVESTSSAGPGTVLTLRARKADVDAFAQGKLDFAAFQAKVEQLAYPGSGHGVTSVNSWVR